jgi:L-threonylcarbamoyladenylate synthase
MKSESAPPVLPPTPENIALAARALKEGRLVAFPTETVYGLGADATSDRAVAGIFAAKNRPAINPLIVHVADRESARGLAVFDRRAEELVAKFWPGPLTLVLQRQNDCPISLLATAGLDTVALRQPRHPIATALLQAFGGPIAAPSANPSGRLSPTSPAHIGSLKGDVAAILDGGATVIGLESTIVDLSGMKPLLLRHGGLAIEEIEALTGPLGRPDARQGPRAPGMLASHYAPRLPLRLEVREATPREALLGFGPSAAGGAKAFLNLSPAGDLTEAAANLFAYLHRLDASGASGIAVAPVPEKGLGRAINDRLRRAAAPRHSR